MSMNTTSSSTSNCPRCGASLDDSSVDGLCARCLGALNFATDTEMPGESTAGNTHVLSPEEIAAHFPQLEILEILGRGGMGVVYKARQKTLDRLVALKLLAPERVADPQFADRFAHEAKALAALSHPNIVTIHDFGQVGGFYYLLMEFVDGVNLRQAMKSSRLTPEQALSIVPPICEALQYAHEHGLVHRDIKPENLLLDKEGRVKIADFGIAKMLSAKFTNDDPFESQPAGTPQYMAPEQKAHRRTDHRADIYSLGVVLYEMLTGELPADKLQPPSKRVHVDVRIDEIVLRALEVKPELRFATASEFRRTVEAALRSAATLPVLTPITSSWQVAVALTITICFAGLISLFVVLDYSVPLRNPAIAAIGVMLVGAPFILLGVLVWCDRAARATLPEQLLRTRQVLRVAAGSAVLLSLMVVPIGLFFVRSLLDQRGNWNPAPDEAVVVPLAWIGMIAIPWAAIVLMRANLSRQQATTVDFTDSASERSIGRSHFSRVAIVGALLMSAALIAWVAVCFGIYQFRSETTSTGPHWWQLALLLPALFLAVAGPIGTTILGWVAVSHIRRSAGRICGLQLAVFDGLVFPLVAVSTLIGLSAVALAKMFVDFYANPSVIDDPRIIPPLVTLLANWLSCHKEVAVFVGVVAATVVNVLVVRAVQRAVRSPLNESASAAPQSSVKESDSLRSEQSMNNAGNWLALIQGTSLLVSVLMHQVFAGAYVRATPADNYTYFIGVVSTTIPFAFWALVTFSVSLIRRGRADHGAAMICGYLAGWVGMTCFTFWIVSWPKTFQPSSNMAITVLFTAFLYAAIFPVLFLSGYVSARILLQQKRET